MRQNRVCMENGMYHVYNQGVDRMKLFRDHQDHKRWIQIVKNCTKKFNVHVYCFVTMKNHFHILLETNDPNISDVVWYLSSYYSRYVKRKYKRVGPLYRNRCQTQIVYSQI